MSSWSFANAHNWIPEPPIDPPVTDWDRYEYEWDQWLHDNYDEDTKTIFGVDSEDDDELYDKLWDKFMEDVIHPRWEP